MKHVQHVEVETIWAVTQTVTGFALAVVITKKEMEK